MDPSITTILADERRRAPRIAMDAPVTLTGSGGRSPALTVNASERGLLVQAADTAWLAADAAVRVRLELDEWPCEIPAEVVRLEPERRWVALRFTGPPQRIVTGSRRRVRRSRAAPKAPRARAEVRAELRSLSALVYEQALMDADAPPVETLLAWADRLAAELSAAGVGRPHDNRSLLHAMVRLCRDADGAAPPER